MAEVISLDHEYRPLSDFRIGDLILAWGREVTVTQIERVGDDRLRLVCRDGQGERDIVARPGEEYIARKRDAGNSLT